MQNINLHQGKLHRSPIQLIGNPYWGDSPSPIKSNRDKPVLGKTSIAVFHTSFPTFPFHPSGHMWNPAPVHKKFQRKHHFHSTISTWFGFFATGTHSTPNSKISTPKFRTWKKSTPEGVQHMYERSTKTALERKINFFRNLIGRIGVQRFMSKYHHVYLLCLQSMKRCLYPRVRV